MEHRDKPEAYFCKRRKMWICELAETIGESTKEEAEKRADMKLAAYRASYLLARENEWLKMVNNSLREDEKTANLALIEFAKQNQQLQKLLDRYENKPASVKCPNCSTIIKTV